MILRRNIGEKEYGLKFTPREQWEVVQRQEFLPLSGMKYPKGSNEYPESYKFCPLKYPPFG